MVRSCRSVTGSSRTRCCASARSQTAPNRSCRARVPAAAPTRSPRGVTGSLMSRSCLRPTTDVVSPFYHLAPGETGGRSDACGSRAPVVAGNSTWGSGGRNVAVRGSTAPARSLSAAGWEESTRCSYEKILVDLNVDLCARDVVAAAIRTPGVIIVITVVVAVVAIVTCRTGVHKGDSHCE
jgi:hypothetical protein